MTNPTTFEDIQKLCRDFRRQLRSGADKRIEEYLDRVYEDSREMLFQNLLHIDIEFQRRQGNEPASDDYIKRFPQYIREVRQAFFESTLMSSDAATPADHATELEDVPAGRKLGGYELLRQIGRGAFGAVFQARHLQRGDVVALKLLPLAVDANANISGEADRLHKFRREFRALSEVNHPNLVGMQTLEVDGNQWFFTMDLVEGTDFLEYVRPGDKLDIARLRSALPQLAEGIAALHRRRIIHRDLKPANVMVDRNGHVLVLDFGLVIEERPRADFTVLMSNHGFAGTPLYASPEQMFGDCEPASDWYAVGVMLFEALTGKPPFRGSAAELMRTKASTEAPALTTQSDIPRDLAQLVDRLLQREPELRPSTETILSQLGGTVDTDSRDSTAESPSASSGGTSRLTLIGRDEELQTLREQHRRLQNDRQPLAVFVRGRSGEGKTALCDEFLRDLRTDYSSLILSGRCYDRESVPFKAVDAIIDSLVLFLRSQQDDDVRRWLPDDIGLLAHLFPMLRRVTAIGEVIPQHRSVDDNRQLRHRAFAAFRDLLTAISANTPVVLFIDDLQWGDGDSATALRDILQPPDAPAVMLLGTYRSDEAADSAFLKEWADYTPMTDAELGQHTIEVHPLSEEQCLNLLAVRLNTNADSVRQQAQQLFAGTRGNPYFLDQLLEGLDPETGTIEAVPLSELIERRLQRLPPAARALLKAIAIAGQAVALPEAAAVANETSVAMSTVTHMRNERLVRLIGSDADSTVDTYHDKVRETVLAELPDAERRQLHLAFGELLESTTDGETNSDNIEPGAKETHPRVFDLAFHFLEAGDSRAFGYQLAAGEKALGEYAMDTAHEYLRTAERILTTEAEQSTRYQLSFALAESLQGLDRLQEARHHYEEALPLAGSRAEAARCDFGIGSGLVRSGQMVSAKTYIARAATTLGEPLPLTRLARVLGLTRSLFEFHVMPTRILRIYRCRKWDAETEALLLPILSTAHYCFLMTSVEQLAILVQHGILCKVSDDPWRRSFGNANYAGVYSSQGVPWIANRYLRRVEKFDATREMPMHEAVVAHAVATNHFFLGKLDTAEGLFLASLPAHRKARLFTAGMTLHWLRHIASVRGDANAIEHWATEELRYGQATDEASTIGYAEYGLADALSRKGRFDEAINLARRAVARLEPTKLNTKHIAPQELGRALLQASDYAGAAATLDENARSLIRGFLLMEVYLDTFSLHLEAMLGPTWHAPSNESSSSKVRKMKRVARWSRWICGRLPTLRPHAYRVNGRAALAAGRPKKALTYFDEALRSAERVGARYEQARTLIDKSWLDYPDAAFDRQCGLELLQELHCVLPEAEVEELRNNVSRCQTSV